MTPTPPADAHERAFWGRLLILVALLTAIHLVRWGMLADARAAGQPVERRYRELRAQFERVARRLRAAQEKHLPRYLEGVQLAEAARALDAAAALLGRSDRSPDPGDVRLCAETAAGHLTNVGPYLGQIEGRLDQLDAALAEYPTLPDRVESACREVEPIAARLREQGYFARHFAPAHEMLARARATAARARELARQPIERGLPDYEAIYRECTAALGDVERARAWIEEVPRRRESNERRLVRYRDRLGFVRSLIPAAEEAAIRLEPYPRYRMRGTLTEAIRALATEDPRLAEVSRRNSMEVQDFDGAARLLAEIEGDLAARRDLLQQAINRAAELVDARQRIEEQSRLAALTITRARQRLEQFRFNGQAEAANLLRQAESVFQSGNGLWDADPIGALTAFSQARLLAERAYSAVDTRARTAPPVGPGRIRFPDSPGWPSGGSIRVPSGPGGGGFRTTPGGGGFRSSPGGGGFGGGL